LPEPVEDSPQPDAVPDDLVFPAGESQ
jgi:hypothetical protein